MATLASPALVFHCEMSLACTYALRHPMQAIDCAWHAYDAAIRMGRPDLANQANELMAAINRDEEYTVTIMEVR